MTEVSPISTGGYFRPRRLGHVNLYISDFEKSLRFYRDVAGLGGGWTRPAIGGAFLNNGYTHHDIGFLPWDSPFARKRASGPGLNHLGFELESELELVESYRSALAAGVPFAATVDHLIAHSLYSWDPSDYGIELYADTELSYMDPDFLALRRASGGWGPGTSDASDQPRYIANPTPKRYESALFHTQKVTGVVLVTDKFDAAYRYYTEFVGLKPVARSASDAFVCLSGRCGGRDVTLFRKSGSLEVGFHHMNCRVFDEADLRDSIQRAKFSGTRIEQSIEHPQRQGVVVRDPDGIGVMFYCESADLLPGLAAVDPASALWLV